MAGYGMVLGGIIMLLSGGVLVLMIIPRTNQLAIVTPSSAPVRGDGRGPLGSKFEAGLVSGCGYI